MLFYSTYDVACQESEELSLALETGLDVEQLLGDLGVVVHTVSLY